MPTISDYIIEDTTGASWPGRLPYRSFWTPKGRGYRTYEEAERRLFAVDRHYNAKKGRSAGVLRVVARFK